MHTIIIAVRSWIMWKVYLFDGEYLKINKKTLIFWIPNNSIWGQSPAFVVASSYYLPNVKREHSRTSWNEKIPHSVGAIVESEELKSERGVRWIACPIDILLLQELIPFRPHFPQPLITISRRNVSKWN